MRKRRSEGEPHLEAVNSILVEYKAAWDIFKDCWLAVKVQDPQYAFRRRFQAELAMKRSGSPGIMDDEVDIVPRGSTKDKEPRKGGGIAAHTVKATRLVRSKEEKASQQYKVDQESQAINLHRTQMPHLAQIPP